jgi:hypothetical protein
MMSNRKRRGGPALLGGALCAAILATAILATPASAAFEQVGCFSGPFPGPANSCKPVVNSEYGEEVQLAGVGGLAVNAGGTGGVPAGTVYAASWNQTEGTTVAMFEPRAGGGLEFVEAWDVDEFLGPYEACGPAAKELPNGSLPGEHSACPPRPGPASGGRVDVAVDQASGNVYVFADFETLVGGEAEIVEYTPSGGAEVTRFGLQAPGGKDTAESPTEFHSLPPFMGPLTVGAGGKVYLADQYLSPSEPSKNYSRVMVFEQETPGDYAHYEYAGEVAAGFQLSQGYVQGPAVDNAGNLYVVNTEKEIEAFAPTAPAAYPAAASTPLCSFRFEAGGITAMTVDPVSGEVFFFSYKTPRRLRRLGPCNPATGKFGSGAVEEALAVAPERNFLTALAVDPAQKFSPGRPGGILYGAAPQVGGDATQSALGYIFAPAEENPPVVSAQAVAHVTSTSAVLRAKIDRKGFDTAYLFQYETAAQFEANPPGERFAGAGEAPSGEAVLGEGSGPQSVAVAVAGLQPNTEYRYRAVAVSHCSPGTPSKTCEADGAVASFRTYPPSAGALPDSRAYELVSPAQKNGGQVLPAEPLVASCPVECKPGTTYNHFPMLSSPDGEAVAYEGTPFAPGGALAENLYLAQRSASGWQSTNPTPALLIGSGYTGLSAGFERAVLSQFQFHNPSLSPEAPEGYENLYTQPSAEPAALTPLLTTQPPVRPASDFRLTYAGASADGQRIFFKANDALTAADPGVAPAAPPVGSGEFDLYEWHQGQLHLVNVLPGNATAAAGSFAGLGSAHGISAAGDRAFWEDATHQLYVREGGAVTKPIPGSGPGAGFLAASVDGAQVLLANGSLYDLEAEASTDLTQGKGGFLGILGSGEDLANAYFVDTAVLPSAAGEENCRAVYVGGGEVCEEAQAGKFNLYAYSEGTPTRFVATLIATDNNDVAAGGAFDWAPSPVARTAEASPGGRYLAFLSHAQLTGYENTGPCELKSGGFIQTPCTEVFVYDSQTGELRCASCNRSGALPLGWSLLRRIAPAAASVPQPRYLTDSGRVYFDSKDSLGPADTNEGAEDVYEWQPEGVPAGADACQSEFGCLALLSAGTGSADSNLLAVDASAKNVFFTTRDRLVPRDKDESIDLYDAREGGGFPESETQRAECQGEACQAAVSAPNDPTPGSASFEGAGEGPHARPRPCAKGRVKQRGKCVRRHRHRSNHRQARQGRGGAR